VLRTTFMRHLHAAQKRQLGPGHAGETGLQREVSFSLGVIPVGVQPSTVLWQSLTRALPCSAGAQGCWAVVSGVEVALGFVMWSTEQLRVHGRIALLLPVLLPVLLAVPHLEACVWVLGVDVIQLEPQELAASRTAILPLQIAPLVLDDALQGPGSGRADHA
jgi:hypothetical protein